jgi:Tfp pilus assembly protein FimT
MPSLRFEPKFSPGCSLTSRGLTTIEMVISVAIILVISAIAIPTLSHTLRVYQLNDAANQLAGIVKFTRFQAIRNNTPISCVNSSTGANAPANVWSDDNSDGVAQPTEKQIILGSIATLIPQSGAPNTGALAAAAGVPTMVALSPPSDHIKFDERGAVTPPNVYVFYVGNTANPSAGFRAVIVMPSGSVQVWTYTGGPAGTWQKVS